MEKDSSSFIRSVLDKVNDLFSDEMGPVAAILCEESRAYWIDKVTKQNKQPGLRNLHIYVNHLAQSIDDEKARKKFIDKVYEMEALKVYKTL